MLENIMFASKIRSKCIKGNSVFLIKNYKIVIEKINNI